MAKACTVAWRAATTSTVMLVSAATPWSVTEASSATVRPGRRPASAALPGSGSRPAPARAGPSLPSPIAGSPSAARGERNGGSRTGVAHRSITRSPTPSLTYSGVWGPA
ncbi:hypothetical protein TPA0909_60860 [Streptomyces albus]|nr:hypothetical protein TPA0909_60860 [Streptomyces albus]